jgi:carbon-monoxide dehydrogenase large subunit
MTDRRFPPWLGVSQPRVEDNRLLRGAGRFLDDIRAERALQAVFVRSSFAHARLRKIDVAAARALPGVIAVFTYEDLRPLLAYDRIPLALPSNAIRFDIDPPPLVSGETCYVGEPIAVVIAENRALAEDAAALVEINYEPLPFVLDPRHGLCKGAA